MINRKSIGLRIRQIRDNLGLKHQYELAALLGVSRNTVSSYETGDVLPQITGLIKIAELGNVSLEWLVMGKDATRKTLKKLLTDNEIRLLTAFENADSEVQTVVLRMLEAVAKEKGPDK